MGAFDDLIPGGKKAAPAKKAPVRRGGAFDDLIPAGKRDLVTDDGQSATATGDRLLREAKEYHENLPTTGMSTLDRLRAGAGSTLVETWKGAKQAATEGTARNAVGVAYLLGKVGLDSAAASVNRTLAQPLMRSVAQQRNEIRDREATNAPLLATGAGRAGQVIGTLAQLLGPGLAVKGTTTGAMLLPRSVGGNAVQGGLLGYIQPADSEEDRLKHATAGAALGFGGAAIPKVIGGTVRGARAASERLTQSGARRRAVREVQAEASNPASLMQPNPSQVPGSLRSLFAESQDAGVARMETRSRGNAAGWAERDKVNNAARIDAIRSFAGDEGTLRSAVAARTQATAPLYAQARGKVGVPLGNDVAASKLDDIATRMKGRRGVEETVNSLRADVENAGSVNELMNIRDTMADMLAGKYAGDTNKALVGSRALMEAKAQLERTIGAAAPIYRTAQREFRELSRPINRMEVGQQVLRNSTGNIMDDLGHYTLSPDKFGSAMKNLDGVAQQATGFRKASAANILEPQDMATLGAVNDDLSREAQRLRYGSGGNSHTASQQELAGRVAGRAASRFMPAVVGDVMDSLERAGQGRLNDALAYVLQNPAEYRRIAASLPAGDRRVLENALSRIGGNAGSMVVPLAPAFSGE